MIGRIRNLRVIGIVEGISYIVLLCIAMPLKYVYGIPEAVKFTGWAHGVLFILYIPAVFLARRSLNWNLLWLLVALSASLIPFATFILDRLLARRARELLSGVTV